jgi:hypothetical protein
MSTADQVAEAFNGKDRFRLHVIPICGGIYDGPQPVPPKVKRESGTDSSSERIEAPLNLRVSSNPRDPGTLSAIRALLSGDSL